MVTGKEYDMIISVVITSYNQKRFLSNAIESVLNQVCRPDQIIIVDDASEDGSHEMIGAYASSYPKIIVPIYNERNLGVSYSRNSALAKVIGDYVCCLDGDDRLLPEKLAEEAKCFSDHPEIGMVFSNHYYINESGQRIGQWINGERMPSGNIFRETFAWDLPRKSMFRNELVNYRLWKHVGFYDCRLKIYEDYEMRVRLTKYLYTKYVDKPLSEYRVHYRGLSNAKFQDHVNAQEYVYLKNQILLQGMNKQVIQYVNKRIGESIGKASQRAADEMLFYGKFELKSRVNALKYFIKSLKYCPKCLNYKLFLNIILPCWLIKLLKSVNSG